MLKWLRNKLAGPVYVDCYTSDIAVFKTARIKSAVNYYPDWWKTLPPEFQMPVFEGVPHFTRKASTMRYCAGFIDLFKKSFCLPLWSDIMIRVEAVGNPSYVWKYADGRSTAVEHSTEQRGKFLSGGEFQHLKLTSPWILVCEEDINFLYFDPFWTSNHEENGVMVPPGIVNFKYQSSTHLNMFVRKLPNAPNTVELKFNTPVAFITPLTERKVVLRYHLVSGEDAKRLERPENTFVGSYEKSKAARLETSSQAKQEQTNV